MCCTADREMSGLAPSKSNDIAFISKAMPSPRNKQGSQMITDRYPALFKAHDNATCAIAAPV